MNTAREISFEFYVNPKLRKPAFELTTRRLALTRKAKFSPFIDIRKRGGMATLLLSIFNLQLSTPEANIAQLVW